MTPALVAVPPKEKQKEGVKPLLFRSSYGSDLSIWAFLDRREANFPILDRIHRELYGLDAVFELSPTQMQDLLAEIKALIEDIESQMRSGKAASTLSAYLEDFRYKNPDAKSQGASPEVAVSGLEALGQLVEEATKCGWVVKNNPD